jgi:virginiamycin A acetyltransferase
VHVFMEALKISTTTVPILSPCLWGRWHWQNYPGMKRLLKFLAELVATLLVLPAVALYYLSRLFLSSQKAFPGWSQRFSMIPGLRGIYMRRAFYRLIFRRCGRDSCISFGTVFSHATVEVGCQVYIGVYCCIGDVTLEDDVLIASHVSIVNGNRQHGIERLDIPVREQPGTWPRITIGRDSWIGERAVVLADVGRHCVIAAGAVVTKPIPDYAIARGVPAQVVGWRKEPLEQTGG